MAQFKSLTDGRVVTASGDEAVARFQSDPELVPVGAEKPARAAKTATPKKASETPTRPAVPGDS